LQLPELPPANTSAIISIKNEDNIFLAFIITQSKLISGNTYKIEIWCTISNLRGCPADAPLIKNAKTTKIKLIFILLLFVLLCRSDPHSVVSSMDKN
jgi:hypothetical protein